MTPWIRRLFVVALLGAIGTVAAVQWSAPSDDWACERSDRCSSTVALDLEAVDFADGWIGWESFDLSPDGSQVVVGLQSSRDPIRNDQRLLIATFSTETGDLLATLVSEELVDLASADEVRFSPDGTLVVAVTATNRGRLQVFETSTGQLVSTIIESEGTSAVRCTGRLGVSPSNDRVQCGSAVYDLASGDVVETLDNQNPFGESRGGFAWSTIGLVADGVGQREIFIRDEAATTNEGQSVIDPARFPNMVDSIMAFAATGNGEHRLVVVQEAEPWRWWSRSPRRSHPEARVSAFSIESGQLEWSMDLGDRAADMATNGQGMIATISADGIITVFDLS